MTRSVRLPIAPKLLSREAFREATSGVPGPQRALPPVPGTERLFRTDVPGVPIVPGPSAEVRSHLRG
jgi:hypothetical protein